MYGTNSLFLGANERNDPMKINSLWNLKYWSLGRGRSDLHQL
jgi:hypothetical protein